MYRFIFLLNKLIFIIILNIIAICCVYSEEQKHIEQYMQNTITLCSTCHGLDGNSTISSNFPKLAGQGKKYLFKQMKDIIQGKRIVKEMDGQLLNLNDKDLSYIASYFSEKTIQFGMSDPALVQKGEMLYRGGKIQENIPSCIGCHGPTGSGVETASYPSLGGQHAAYIKTQLTNFREGVRTNNNIMTSISSKLSNKDIEALSSYIEGLH